MREVLVKHRLLTVLFVLIAIMLGACANCNTIYAETKADEGLVNSVSSPSNGVIKFKVKCPAKSKVEVKVSLTPNNKGTSIDKKTWTFENKKGTSVTKTYTYSAKYFSNKYKVHAKATIGNPRNKKYRTDTDDAKSKLVKTVNSKKLTWTKERIHRYNAGKAVSALVGLSTGVVVSIVATPEVGTAYTLVAACVEGASIIAGVSDEYTSKRIQTVPREGWSWKFTYKVDGSKYTRYLYVYDDKGRFDSKYKMGTYSYDIITPALH